MGEAITAFRIDTAQAALDDLTRRLEQTRWPERETVDDWSQGIPLGYMQDVCAYWARDYDWRATEARLNALPQFTTVIDGLAIHFLHLRSPCEDALPLLLTHGWPGSIIEFMKVLGPLRDPVAHGGAARDGFHVVVPSLPGYGYSGKPARPGWGVAKVAAAWDALMVRLGYRRYVAQGGDWGAAVTTAIGVQNRGHCAGIHVNMPIVGPDKSTFDELTAQEQSALAASKFYQDWDCGYSKQQSTRPQTLGYGLADSPSGQAAWILEKFYQWMDCDGHPENVVSRDELLDNIMMYWLTGSGASSARLYWESFGKPVPGKIIIPAGCSLFPKEIFRASKRWVERRFNQLVYWNELDRGGHFAAFERPEAFVAELRQCFALMRG